MHQEVIFEPGPFSSYMDLLGCGDPIF